MQSNTPISNMQNEEPINARDVIGGVAALTWLGGGIAAWGLRSMPEFIEHANTCGKVATVALAINWVCVQVRQSLDNK